MFVFVFHFSYPDLSEKLDCVLLFDLFYRIVLSDEIFFALLKNAICGLRVRCILSDHLTAQFLTFGCVIYYPSQQRNFGITVPCFRLPSLPRCDVVMERACYASRIQDFYTRLPVISLTIHTANITPNESVKPQTQTFVYFGFM